MTGYQLEAVDDQRPHITVRASVVYIDKRMAVGALETLQRSEPGGMTWRIAVVEINTEAV